MMIYFDCTANMDYPYVNSATFLYDGREVTVDRDSTYYSYDSETGSLTMDWESLYIWNGEEPDYDIPAGFPERAVLVELDVEDDAPDGYKFELLSYEITD